MLRLSFSTAWSWLVWVRAAGTPISTATRLPGRGLVLTFRSAAAVLAAEVLAVLAAGLMEEIRETDGRTNSAGQPTILGTGL
jgi:hypothetical protein